MTEKERWQEVMREMETEALTLSPKISYTMKKSLTGMLFILARYKFGMKMMQNRSDMKILDLGCNDGIGDLMIRQNINAQSIIGVDFDSDAIGWAKENLEDDVLHFIEDDFLGKVYGGGADAVISMDVIEHIPKEKETVFRDTIYDNLNDHGFAVIGTPNVTIYPYANPINKKSHINNFDQKRLYELFASKFNNVFIFGMNDETVNTGFYPFSCYIVALCCK